MPGWNDVLNEITAISGENVLDSVRRKYLAELANTTGRNVIAYYSSFIDKPRAEGVDINDSDINAFMAVIHKLDRSKGLDLILHTPGGGIAATESLVTYLKKMFGNDIRAIVPQISMSAGTMIACACKAIMMGKQSSIGPIDPQFGGIAAESVIEEFQSAIQAVKDDPSTVEIWKTVVDKYPPTFIGECNNAIRMSKKVVTEWLKENMFSTLPDPGQRAKEVTNQLASHNTTMTHARHIDSENAKRIGLVIEDMEDDDELQDRVLTVHHSYMHTLSSTTVKKIVENQNGVAVVQLAKLPN